MDNWNYELAKAYADNIEDMTTRRLTQFFLTRFLLLAFRKHAVPENGEIDLLCYVKITEEIVKQHDLIKRCLQGEDLDAAWNAFSEELGKSESGTDREWNCETARCELAGPGSKT